ncbi:MAG: hypothetical protein Dasosvirus10_9 [Dasosvirus sp.]|uniref:Uncharacterized protein n=1 Tax=Dasosvirus sp. TaxID=2487764 RepID=A0A3G4ZRR8_9VIRU|nr:MAG: hypothetical protein Dasosvirus10_9 [Dasosvirus sp.]
MSSKHQKYIHTFSTKISREVESINTKKRSFKNTSKTKRMLIPFIDGLKMPRTVLVSKYELKITRKNYTKINQEEKSSSCPLY